MVCILCQAEEFRQRVEMLETRLRESDISMADLPSLPPVIPGPPPPPPPPPHSHPQPPLPPPPPVPLHQLYTTPSLFENVKSLQIVNFLSLSLFWLPQMAQSLLRRQCQKVEV